MTKIKKEKENRKNIHFLWKREKRMKKEKNDHQQQIVITCRTKRKSWARR
jgi:hypothetical protein